MVCGLPTIDLDLLKRCSIYSDGYTAESRPVQLFWEAMKDFTEQVSGVHSCHRACDMSALLFVRCSFPQERSLYLRFVWGRSRLPLRYDKARCCSRVNFELLTILLPSCAGPRTSTRSTSSSANATPALCATRYQLRTRASSRSTCPSTTPRS